MKTYRILSTGIIVGTKAEAEREGAYEVLEIPTSKPELIEFVNTLQAPQPAEGLEPEPESDYKQESRKRGEQLSYEVNLEEALWNSSFEECTRLAQIVMERINEHVRNFS